MNNSQNFSEQIALDISMQAFRLEAVRLRLFLEWLNAHISQMDLAIPNAQTLEDTKQDLKEECTKRLRVWFAGMSQQGGLWEYHLILDEIQWWRELDEDRLSKLGSTRLKD